MRILFLFLLLSISCKQDDLQVQSIEFNIAAANKNDSIYLVNKTSQKLGFYYEDKYLNLVQIHLLPDSSLKLFADAQLVLTQTNKNQNLYLLYAGDTLYADVTTSGNAILSVKDDSVRNNELKLQWMMNDKTPLNFWKINNLRGKYFNTDLKKMDSIYLSNYKDKIDFINNYKQTFTISNSYEKLIKAYLKGQLYANELWLGTTSKAKIDKSYVDYLVSLKEHILSLVSDSENQVYNFLQFGYERFLQRKLLKSELYLDSMYSNCKKNINKKTKDLVLLKIIKEELQKNKNSTKWFINDFIKTGENNDYKNYIISTIENQKLALSTGNNNFLTNQLNHTFQYDSLIKSLKGKIIYIDVWASWCAPCRAEMPNSLALKNKYDNGKVVVLFLSIDEDVAAWKKVNKDENLGNYAYSYLLLNAQETDFVKKLKISSIPRYILIDKKGQICNSKAPHPGEPELVSLLDKLMAQ